MTSNEIRQIIGMKPSEDPNADKLRNKNLSESNGDKSTSLDSVTEEKIERTIK
jgi:hypothetical protein